MTDSLSRRSFVKTSTLAAGTWAVATARGEDRSPDAERPNFLYIFSDQQHWRAMGRVDSFFDTPNLDALAGDAAHFDRAFCTTPQCSPSRSSMLTGLYPHKTGVLGNVGAAGGAPLTTKTIGATLQETGYRTGYFGKWHLGADQIGCGGWGVRAAGGDAATTKNSIAFLQSDAAAREPFALIASYNDPHDIYHFNPDKDTATGDVPLPESWSRETFADKPSIHREFMTRDQGRKIWGRPQEVWEAYHDFYRRKVRLFDEHVGGVLDTLKRAGLWEKTVVIVGSDHGDMDTAHKLIFKGPFMYDEMVRVPLVVRLPEAFGGTLRGPVEDHDAVNVDLVPTIRELAGLAPIECDGLSLAPLLRGAADPPKRDYVVGQYYSKQKWVNPIRMIRTSRFKYNRYIDHGEELYDLADDPGEIVNLAGDPERAAVKRELSDELDQWMQANQDPFPQLKTVPLTKGYDWKPGRS